MHDEKKSLTVPILQQRKLKDINKILYKTFPGQDFSVRDIR